MASPPITLSFPYEGGTEKREFVLGQGLDINQIASTLSNKGEDWLTALVENGKMTIVCERWPFMIGIFVFFMTSFRYFTLTYFMQEFIFKVVQYE